LEWNRCSVWNGIGVQFAPEYANIFRKAYILKAFDRGTSDKMLKMLADNGLGLLPSIRKAGKLVRTGNSVEMKRVR